MSVTWESVLLDASFRELLDKEDEFITQALTDKILPAIKELYRQDPNPPETFDIDRLHLSNPDVDYIGASIQRINTAITRYDFDRSRFNKFDISSAISFKDFSINSFKNLEKIFLEKIIKDGSSQPSVNETTPVSARKQDSIDDNSEEFTAFSKNIEQAAREAEKSAKSAAKARKAAINAQKTAENIIPNMLTTLGIFVAIIIAVVAVYLGTLIVSRNSDAQILLPSFRTCLIMGHILLNTIFLLLYLVSKLTGKSVAVFCIMFTPTVQTQTDKTKDPSERAEQEEILNEFQESSFEPLCKTCSHQHNCHKLDRFWNRYPYMVLINCCFLLSYVCLALWHLTYPYINETFTQITIDPLWKVIIAWAAVIIVISVISVALHFIGLTHRINKIKKSAHSKKLKDAFARLCNTFTGFWSNLSQKIGYSIFRKEIQAIEREIKDLTEELSEVRKQLNESSPGSGNLDGPEHEHGDNSDREPASVMPGAEEGRK